MPDVPAPTRSHHVRHTEDPIPRAEAADRLASLPRRVRETNGSRSMTPPGLKAVFSSQYWYGSGINIASPARVEVDNPMSVPAPTMVCGAQDANCANVPPRVVFGTNENSHRHASNSERS